ncbi:MAG: dodecin family protein [Nitrosopumilus sp.]|nr:dodecin domain-containing protein [Nitrososphaerota archaeon]
MAVKIIELMGTSSESWPKAVEEAVSKAGESLRNIHAVDVISLKAKVANGKISEYRADVKIAFVIE